MSTSKSRRNRLAVARELLRRAAGSPAGAGVMSIDPLDVLAAIAAGLITAGAALVFIPAGLVVLGVLLLVYVIAVARATPNEPEEQS